MSQPEEKSAALIQEELTEEAIRELAERQAKYRHPWKRPVLAWVGALTAVASVAVVSVLLVRGSADDSVVEPAPARSFSPDKEYAKRTMAKKYNWGDNEFSSLDSLWQKESGWDPKAKNASSGAYGIPQALPGRRMVSAGKDWRNNPETQIDWGLKYIKAQYGTPTKAWNTSQATGAY
jgi:hypothetical protein